VGRERFRDGQRVTAEAGDALPPGVVQTCHRRGWPGGRRAGSRGGRWHDPGGDRLGIGIAQRLRALPRRPMAPPGLARACLRAPPWHARLCRGYVSRALPPLRVRRCVPAAPPRLGFPRAPSAAPSPGRRPGPPMERRRRPRLLAPPARPRPGQARGAPSQRAPQRRGSSVSTPGGASQPTCQPQAWHE
jgi:hypothetical protein